MTRFMSPTSQPTTSNKVPNQVIVTTPSSLSKQQRSVLENKTNEEEKEDDFQDTLNNGTMFDESAMQLENNNGEGK